MIRFPKILLASLFAALLSVSAFAQLPTSVQQTASKLDVATFLQGPPAGGTLCSTVNSTAAAGTVTITPPAGQYVVITGVYIDVTADVTGLTGQATMSTTNISGSPIWSLATIIPTANANGTVRQIAEHYPTGLRSTVAGTAVTFVPSAQSNHVIFCTRVAGYFVSQ